MTGGYLLDTNIASYVINGRFPTVRRRLVKVPMAMVAISAVTEGELTYGVARLQDAMQLGKIVDEFLLRVNVLPWDSLAARGYGRLRATLEREGRTLGNLDMMIAAHALVSDLILVTHDQAFKRIKKLTIEDWTSE